MKKFYPVVFVLGLLAAASSFALEVKEGSCEAGSDDFARCTVIENGREETRYLPIAILKCNQMKGWQSDRECKQTGIECYFAHTTTQLCTLQALFTINPETGEPDSTSVPATVCEDPILKCLNDSSCTSYYCYAPSYGTWALTSSHPAYPPAKRKK